MPKQTGKADDGLFPFDRIDPLLAVLAGSVLLGLSLIAIPVGAVLWLIWQDEAYCELSPGSGPNMRVDRSCTEILAEAHGWEGTVGIGGFVAMCVGLAVWGVVLVVYVRDKLRQ